MNELKLEDDIVTISFLYKGKLYASGVDLRGIRNSTNSDKQVLCREWLNKLVDSMMMFLDEKKLYERD